MGLPLFVAPVKSDLPLKSAGKTSASSPPRSGIRRSSHAPRERRARREARFQNAVNREIAQTLEERMIEAVAEERRESERSARRQPAGPTRRLSWTSPPHGGDDMQWRMWLRQMEARRLQTDLAENRSMPQRRSNLPSSNVSSANSAYNSEVEFRPFREVLREMSHSDEQRRARMEEHVYSLFGPPGQDGEAGAPGPASDRAVDGTGSVTQPRAPIRRARITQAAPTIQHIEHSYEDRLPRANRPNTATEREDRHRRPNMSQTSRPSDRHIERQSTISRRLPGRRHLEARRSPMDGLGDRERSVSPEVWDTLLTTLTPDPQPPSVSSSFVSVNHTQSTGASSNTTPLPSQAAGEMMPDQGCESGWESSDGEHTSLSARAAREERRLLRESEGARSRAYTPMQGPFVQLGDQDDRSQRNGRPDGIPRQLQLREGQDGWVGRLFVGDDVPTDTVNNGQDDLRPGIDGTVNRGEELSGMQRIVRRMAMREDIPDEWWAEAGLSRTLPQNESN